MNRWQSLSFNIFSTAFLSMLTYIGYIAIINNGVELGEPMWKGFVIQVLFHSIFSLMLLVIIILPLFLLTIKLIKNKTISYAVASFVIFLSFMWLYYALQGEFWWGSLIPSIVGTIVFITIEYLTSASSRSRYSLGRS